MFLELKTQHAGTFVVLTKMTKHIRTTFGHQLELILKKKEEEEKKNEKKKVYALDWTEENGQYLDFFFSFSLSSDRRIPASCLSVAFCRYRNSVHAFSHSKNQYWLCGGRFVWLPVQTSASSWRCGHRVIAWELASPSAGMLGKFVKAEQMKLGSPAARFLVIHSSFCWIVFFVVCLFVCFFCLIIYPSPSVWFLVIHSTAGTFFVCLFVCLFNYLSKSINVFLEIHSTAGTFVCLFV